MMLFLLVFDLLVFVERGHAGGVLEAASAEQNATRLARDEAGNSTNYATFDPNVKMELNSDGRIVIKIAHLGAVGVMPNDDKIVEVAREQLIDEGILGDDIAFEFVSRATCSEAYEGVAVAAEMFHVQKARAFIGPYCATELESVAKMATFWNIPLISYGSTSSGMSDKAIYKTLARISSKNTEAISEATAALLRHYNWTRIAIASNTGSMAYERVAVFEDVLHRHGVSVVKKVLFDENGDANQMIGSGLLEELANSARVVICLFSSTRELSKEFMQATYTLGMNNAEWAYILPWIQSGPKDTSPWIGADGEMLQRVKDHYANAIIVDDVNGFDDSVVENFLQRIERHNIKREDLDVVE
ncbi:unnamed protein product, partial [Mesorhabditis spiculigera]